MAGKSDIEAGRAFVRLYVRDSALLKGLSSIKTELTRLSVHAMRVGGVMAGIGAAIAAPLLGAVKSFANVGDELNKMSDRTGSSVESLSELKYAAAQSGADLVTLEGGIRKMQDALGEAAKGSDSAKEKFKAIGVSVADLMKMTPDQQFKAVAEGISRIQNPALRTAATIDILGKSGTNLLPLMLAGKSGIEQLEAAGRKLGVTMSKEDAAAATLFGDTLADLQETIRGVVNQGGAALAPMLTDILKVTVEVTSGVTKWIRENRQLFVSIFKVGTGLLASGAAIFAFGKAMNLAISGMDRLQSVLAPFDVISPLLRKAAELSVAFGKSSVTAFNRVVSAVGMIATRSAQVVGRVASLLGSLTGATARLATTFASAAFAAGRSLYNGIASQVRRLVANMPALMNGVVAGVRNALARASAAGSAFNTEMRYWLSRPFEYFKALTPLFAGDFALAWQNAGVRVRAIMATAASGMQLAWSAASARVSAVVGQVTSFIAARWTSVSNSVASRVLTAWTSMASAVSSRVTTAWNAITAKLGPIANRIGNMLKPILPLLGADFARIAGYARMGFSAATVVARVAAGGIVGAFRTAGPMIARGLVAAAGGAFARIRSMGASTAAAMGRGIGSGARGIGGAVSGIAGLLGSIGGGALGQLAGIVPQLLMVGSSLAAALNPATLLIAAIGGGIYLWTAYSESGKAALAAVMAAIEPFLAIIKKTFSGIYDAIKGGDLALAGQIAITGLKLVFMEGMEAIGDLLGGGVGKAFKRIGGQIVGGDFAGAWKTAVTSMGAMWDLFSANIVKSMRKAIGFVIGMWKVGVTSITDFLLEASAGGGATGAVASAFLGVNMKDEKERNALMDEKNRPAAIRNQEGMNLAHQKSLDEAKAAGNQKEIDRFTNSLAMGVAKLAELRGGKTAGPSFEEAMKQAGHEAFEASDWTQRAAEYEAELKRIEEAAIAAAKVSGDNLETALPDDTAERDARKKELESKLAALNAEAAKKRKEVEDKAAGADQPPPGADDLPTAKDMKNFGTFSGQALMLGGADGGANARIAKGVEDQKELLAKCLKEFADAGKGITNLYTALMMGP
jgi:hypothetical protein